MNTIDRNILIDQVLKQRRAFQAPSAEQSNLPTIIPAQKELPFDTQPDVRPGKTVIEGLAAAQPRLVSENVDTLDRGFRRTQIFRQSDGRNFVRNEEVTLTERGLKRTITQENPSGSTVQFEENLDRQANGDFRRTVRYTDEIGGVQTKVDDAQSGIDPFIASGGMPASTASRFENRRGLSIDISV